MSKDKIKKAQRAETGKDELIVRQAARIESLEEVQRVGKVYVEELLKAGGVLRDQVSQLELDNINLQNTYQNTVHTQTARINELETALLDEHVKLETIRMQANMKDHGTYEDVVPVPEDAAVVSGAPVG